MFKVNNRNAKTRYEIFSKLTIKTPEWHQNKFIVNFEHISQIRSSVSISNFEHVKASWDKGTRATSMDQREWIVLLSLSEEYLESSRTSIIKSFCENSYLLLTVNYFCKIASSYMFGWFLITTLSVIAFEHILALKCSRSVPACLPI